VNFMLMDPCILCPWIREIYARGSVKFMLVDP
jgi:hypothetical protein